MSTFDKREQGFENIDFEESGPFLEPFIPHERAVSNASFFEQGHDTVLGHGAVLFAFDGHVPLDFIFFGFLGGALLGLVAPPHQNHVGAFLTPDLKDFPLHLFVRDGVACTTFFTRKLHR